MKFYRIDNGSSVAYAGTMDEVKEIVKSVDAVYRSALVIDEADLATDKGSLLALLNDNGTRPDGSGVFTDTGRKFKATARGGVQEAA